MELKNNLDLRLKHFVVVITFLLLISKSAFAVDPTLDWKTIESENLYVHFSDGNYNIAERVSAIAEAAHIRLTDELQWHPVDKTHIVLSDETDLPNGYAAPIFFNRTVIFLAQPTSINTLEDFDDWLTTLIFHEYTHIIHLDKSAGSPEWLRNVLGRFFLLFPNLFQPSWVIEGLATHKETYLERGVGRGQSTMFASMMREEVANGLKPLSQVNLPVRTWPAGTVRYLYGVYFMRFIAENYGEEKLQLWIEDYSDNLIPFFVNSNSKQTFGKDMPLLWQEYQQWLEEKFQPQIKSIRSKGIRAGKRISEDAYRTDSVRAITTEAGEEVFYVRNGGYKRASLMRINADGESEELADLNTAADLDSHPVAGLLLTQNEYCNNYTIYKDIFLYDESLGQLKRLTECGRYLYASWHPDGADIIAVHNDANTFELHLLDKSAQLKEVLWRATDGEILGQIDVSPDGKNIVAAKWQRDSGWNLGLYDIETSSWKKITSGVSITANPQFAPDGNILFSLEADGVYNLHRYDVVSKHIEQLTNLIGGAFQSSQASVDGAIYYAGYTADGYAIYKLDVDEANAAEMFAEPEDTSVSYLNAPSYEVSSRQEKDYSALSNMSPRWWFPTFQISDQRSDLGVTTSGADALSIHSYSINASYDSKLSLPAGSLSYAYADRLFLSTARMNEISLDSNGDIDRVSKRDITSAVLSFPDKQMQQQSDLLFSLIHDKTSDEKLAIGATPFESFEDSLLGVAWLYNSADLNALSISLNDGVKVRLVAEDSEVLNSDYSGQVFTVDLRKYHRLGKESVLALRFLQGWGTDQPKDFKLGGEGIGDNVVNTILGYTNNDRVFNARRYGLRGYKEGLPQLRGRRAQILTAEWRFPLQRLEQGVMAPPIGLMQWFGTLFAETGSAYHDSPETYYSSAGFELSADVALFYNLVLRGRLGYAHGFDKALGDDRVYIKVGSSF